MSVVSQRRLEDFLCLLGTTAFTIGVRWLGLHGHIRSCVIAWCVLEQKRDHPRPRVCHRHSYGSCHPARRGRGHPCCLTILMHLLQIKHPLLAQAQDSGRVALTGVIVIVFWGQICSKGAISGKVSTLCGRSSTPQSKRSRSPASLRGGRHPQVGWTCLRCSPAAAAKQDCIT